ncbi:hypothetical protein CAS74_003747 [Pichia kudriavzevii]|uniref:Uncharacterized protein n=1 Tax=Pichia kudriavzevii TaxID=4909 RepID=A0A099P0S3_PICKU|nr:hypothetical protein JL09_g2366 [Pichia kudriavzevii]ONH74167.1 hypothetical protein BOH78_2622 [Pichia kudriavzevii]OUT21626.1 hypothetical protein CAS74_003747 [Pichia kudriavzevii]
MNIFCIVTAFIIPVLAITVPPGCVQFVPTTIYQVGPSPTTINGELTYITTSFGFVGRTLSICSPYGELFTEEFGAETTVTTLTLPTSTTTSTTTHCGLKRDCTAN